MRIGDQHQPFAEPQIPRPGNPSGPATHAAAFLNLGYRLAAESAAAVSDAAAAAGRSATFEAERPRLTGLAYRMLGTRDDAEDVVQDAWLRWDRAATAVDNPAAWLTTAVSRLALDRLRARQRDRTTYVGPWLPEPLVTATDSTADGADPAERAVMRESLSLGFLHVLERLTPRERVAFVLSEVFDESHARIGDVVGATATASRQLVHRARRKLADERPPDVVTHDGLGAVVDAFVEACASGEIDALLHVLAPDVVLVSDGGAERHAARRPVVGPQRVAQFVTTIVKRMPPSTVVERPIVNGGPAIVLRGPDGPLLAMGFEATAAGLRRLTIIVAPAKLARLDEPAHLV